MSAIEPIRVDELRTVDDLAGIPDDELAWLAAEAEVLELDAGTGFYEPGAPAVDFWIVIRGVVEMTRTDPQLEMRSMLVRAGEITGRLPFSRMRAFPGHATALEPVRAGALAHDRVEDYARHVPQTLARLVHLMLKRARRFTQAGAQREKLVGLGTMAAGLAHELNNPASAARRSAAELAVLIERLDEATAHLVRALALPADADRATAGGPTSDDLGSLLAGARNEAGGARLSPVERADREDELGAWLDDRGLPDPWDLAAALVAAGFDREGLIPVLARVPSEHRRAVLVWLASGAAMQSVGSELVEATDRISALVSAMKSYSYMDQSEEKGPVDVAKGIQDTITILGFKLRDHGVELHSELPDLPPVLGFGSELNQVWTNLIDNALVAASEGGGTVRVRARHAPGSDDVVVEIWDDGPGVPPEIRPRIFEPFFTTKGVGEGTGMGLDLAHRIVTERHHGSLTVESEPGDTRFVVRLPSGVSDGTPSGASS